MVNKDRTSITVNSEVYSKAKKFCENHLGNDNKKLSFSELVTIALELFLSEQKEKPETTIVYTDNVTNLSEFKSQAENVSNV